MLQRNVSSSYSNHKSILYTKSLYGRIKLEIIGISSEYEKGAWKDEKDDRKHSDPVYADHDSAFAGRPCGGASPCAEQSLQQ